MILASESFTADYLLVLAAFVSAGVALYALKIANSNLNAVTEQLKIAKQSLVNLDETLRNNHLLAILGIEDRLADLQRECSNLATDFLLLDARGEIPFRERQAKLAHLEAAREVWFNAIDRLAFCILREYFDPEHWETEYKPYLVSVLNDHPECFGKDSEHTNIRLLGLKWGILNDETLSKLTG